jgi:hypothetical protein
VLVSYNYSVDPQTGGRVVTKTFPGGVTEITNYYRDGRVKSISGTGAVAQAFTYGVEAEEVNPEHRLWEKVEKARPSRVELVRSQLEGNTTGSVSFGSKSAIDQLRPAAFDGSSTQTELQ